MALLLRNRIPESLMPRMRAVQIQPLETSPPILTGDET